MSAKSSDTALSSARLAVRALQALCAVLAMIFTSLGYIKFTSGQLSSGSAIYTTIASYSAMLCGLYYVLPVGVLKLTTTAPKVVYQRLVDAVLVVALLVAGIVHATSDAVKDCKSYNTMFETYHGSALFRCGDMTVAIVLTFVTCALFLVTLVWSFVRDTWGTVRGDNLQAALADDDAQAGANGYVAASTPGKKNPSSASATADLDLQHPGLKIVRCSGRTLQFACSVVALVCIVLGYKHYYTGQYIEPKATYAILMAYSAMLYSLWHMVAVETLKLSRHPTVGVERFMDVLMAAALLVAGILFATSSQVSDCSASNASFEQYHGAGLFRCGSMNTGYIFCFVAVALYLATFALSFLFRSSSSDRDLESNHSGETAQAGSDAGQQV
ncbi:hypothetical protein BBO99_00005098 [Phytophthora kernoviae]|uniref:Uncharacterized protein n=2 Tax=Phytophthora kernoviae TaxID=325452 RepID=A0A3R7IP52_9STRA|nr:hypothetical protein G195_008353 [Phytophthora kernoviae 00238/432]KAG2519399.1 hypothetical protein JM16_007167 [Phytophthora kernoviae]KAG2520533.1 hypothetical protein JM18_007056 [Phytophthora kernoviae]RLN44333.1 hypothetical protein BBI17_005201 [Phytophthora kernoviae]RLN79649.1 hypothetical protein BBO99_00005098 [Phytophthora kernoviae]